MLNKSCLAPIFLTLAILANCAYARDYAVEVIIFERPLSDKEPAEFWNFSTERVAGKLEKLQDLSSKSVEFETSPELDNLEVIRENLITSGYQILHTSNWVQPALLYQHAPVINLGIANTSLPQAFVRVYRTSLIFADINLQLVPLSLSPFSSTPTVSIANEIQESSEAGFTGESAGVRQENMLMESKPYQQPQYFLSEKRRLKFNEVHYFDHPRFGVIMGVWPEEETKIETELEENPETESAHES